MTFFVIIITVMTPASNWEMSETMQRAVFHDQVSVFLTPCRSQRATGRGWKDLSLLGMFLCARRCGLLQLNLPRNSADGERKSCICICHFRPARMWVEVSANKLHLVYATNTFSALHECSLSVYGEFEDLLSVSWFSFSPVYFIFYNSNFHSVTRY